MPIVNETFDRFEFKYKDLVTVIEGLNLIFLKIIFKSTMMNNLS